MAKSSDLIQGTLDLLILKTLARGPVHGWGIAKRIEQLSDPRFTGLSSRAGFQPSGETPIWAGARNSTRSRATARNNWKTN